MPSALIRNQPLNNAPPDGVLPYGQNCVAMALSRVLGIGVTPAINLCIVKGWAPTPGALQYDNAIATVMAGLPLANRATNEAWLTLRARLSTLPDGRYFAVNSGVNDFGGQGVGHAFAIIKNGSWGTYANNQEKKGENYGSRIPGGSKISVWGPA